MRCQIASPKLQIRWHGKQSRKKHNENSYPNVFHSATPRRIKCGQKGGMISSVHTEIAWWNEIVQIQIHCGQLPSMTHQLIWFYLWACNEAASHTGYHDTVERDTVVYDARDYDTVDYGCSQLPSVTFGLNVVEQGEQLHTCAFVCVVLCAIVMHIWRAHAW